MVVWAQAVSSHAGEEKLTRDSGQGLCNSHLVKQKPPTLQVGIQEKIFV